MNRFWRVFAMWFVAVAAVWTFANLPRDGGSLKPFLEWAGFPWTFAFWKWDHLEWFNGAALAANIAVGIGAALAIGIICAWSRCRFVARRPTPHAG
jgi:hypothetical protein